jgi:hypothetical protein
MCRRPVLGLDGAEGFLIVAAVFHHIVILPTVYLHPSYVRHE